MTIPMIIGVFAIMSYQLVDSAFIGQLGVKPLAVVGFTIPVYQLIIGIQVGIGIATTAVISRSLGANNQQQARQLGTLVISIGFLLLLLLCVLIWLNQSRLLGILGAEADIYPIAQAYWLPWLVSTWLGAMLYFGYSIYRAHGHTKLPGLVMVVTSVLNMLLDPLFIFVFDMGIAGAAWATICAFCVGCLIIYPRILSKQWMSLQLKLKENLDGLRQLISIMIPAMMSQFIPPISAMAATAIVAAFGESVIAAWGLGTRIEFFSIIIVLALTMGMPPMVGRMRGAQEFEKIHQLVKLALGFVMGWQLLIAVIGLTVSGMIGRLLTSDLVVAEILQDYLWRVPFSFGALGCCMILVSVCNAMGLSMRALMISALRLLCFYLPCLWVGAQMNGLNGLFIGAMLGNLGAGIMSWFMYKQALNQLRRSR
ncbi:MATE family efflux transporter [Shewanella gelidii]|uniref:MATE family efflux transporter n=2 Tax=Shewanella gelidii TaxID=1642821 RepID=A0A917JIU3_9GAMM|nr:MATE family efflux transporter [Shewanella gelidii]